VIGDADDAAVEVEAQAPKCSSLILSRFLFTCGHVALQELIHLDVAVFGELKRRRAVCEASKQSKTGAGKPSSKSARSSIVSVAASATKTHKVRSPSLNFQLLFWSCYAFSAVMLLAVR